ncbi:hypothetical protein GCM10023108_38960 [Saccharopolyspora hordei]
MRKALVAGLASAGLLLAGCGSEGDDGGSTDGTSEPTPSAPATQSSRSGPAKSVNLPDPCAVLTQEQRQSLGIDQPATPSESNGKQGCDISSGEAGSGRGWTGTIAADPSRTMQQFASSGTGAQQIELAGYPAAQVDNGSGCMLAVDVSDTGSLFVNLIVRPGGGEQVRACEQAAKIAEVAVQNLPNA